MDRARGKKPLTRLDSREFTLHFDRTTINISKIPEIEMIVGYAALLPSIKLLALKPS
jgi:hypothetical protein